MITPPCWAEIIRPYQAIYGTEWQVGLRLSGTAESSLKRDQQGYWRLHTEASTKFTNFTESSRFSLQQQQLVPLEYFHQRQVLNRSHLVRLTFNWQQGQVLNMVNDRSWHMPITPGTYDKQTVQLQLRRDLMAHQTDLSYTVADDGRLEVFAYQVEAEESLETPLGRLHTIRVKRDRGTNSTRNTWIWFAPQYQFMIVRVEQHETSGRRYLLNLQQLTWLDWP